MQALPVLVQRIKPGGDSRAYKLYDFAFSTKTSTAVAPRAW
jgi:hypothetical protein